MQITIDPNNNKTVKLTVEEKRNVMIDELNQRKQNLSKESDSFTIEALNYVLNKISNRYTNARFDDIFEYGMEYITQNDDLSFNQKTAIVKQLAIMSCKLMQKW